jgi:hypothetical protein
MRTKWRHESRRRRFRKQRGRHAHDQVSKIGERGIVDLIAVSDYYVLVSMTLNVDRTPVPGDGKPPLKPLPR